jgi:hypothetical protein
MPGRLGPRFAIEALFLIALAGGAAYADLERKWIALVMAGGWLVVALLELAADRIWATAPPWRRPYYMAVSPPAEPAVVPSAAPPAAAEPEPEPAPAAEVESEPEPEPEPELPPQPEPPQEPEPVPVPESEPEAEAATVIVRPAGMSGQAAGDADEPEGDGEPEAAPPAEELSRPTLEPLEAAPKRRWFRRRKDEEEAVEALLPEPPKHVRLLPPSEQSSRVSAELEDTFETTDSEERSRR